MRYSLLFLIFFISYAFGIPASWLFALRRKDKRSTAIIFLVLFFVGTLFGIYAFLQASYDNASLDIAHTEFGDLFMYLVVFVGPPAWCCFEVILWWRSHRRRPESPPLSQ